MKFIAARGFPAGVSAGFTTRDGGVSQGDHASLNLSYKVGDDPSCVTVNRMALPTLLGEGCRGVVFMSQVHGAAVRVATSGDLGVEHEADALVTTERGLGLAVQVADCLPLLLCTAGGRAVAAVHCGWRSMRQGIIGKVAAELGKCADGPLLAFMGPAIGPRSYEVGPELRESFLGLDPALGAAFTPGVGDRLQCSLYAICRALLGKAGVTGIGGGDHDTYQETDLFYSYRRCRLGGRQAGIIMLRP
ncbi:MAG: polyphenol oxidase family protein [Succinivibrionaceae bacterium]|nr:polyphenol oxidase family protein [Succinivibrionaceae bacterium]